MSSPEKSGHPKIMFGIGLDLASSHLTLDVKNHFPQIPACFLINLFLFYLEDTFSTMDFESPDVAKEFPGLYASEGMKRSQSRNSDCKLRLELLQYFEYFLDFFCWVFYSFKITYLYFYSSFISFIFAFFNYVVSYLI